MFRRKKKQITLINNMDDSRTIVYDFRRRLTEFESYRPAEYRLTPALEEDYVKPLLDEHLSKLFAGSIDDANGDVLDRIIFAGAREGKPDLSRQRLEHKDMLARLVARYKSDYHDLSNLRELRKEELDELRADYDETNRMVAKDMGKEVSA